MKAGDIMTRNVITIDANSTVAQAAQRMLDHRISGMPVVDDSGKVIGIISEGDLLHRAETGTERRTSWWLGLVAGASSQAENFTREHGRTVRDVMSTNVISVDENADLNEVVHLMESRRIKRVPVLGNRQVVGIISRANLMRVLVTIEPAAAARPMTTARSGSGCSKLTRARAGRRTSGRMSSSRTASSISGAPCGRKRNVRPCWSAPGM